MYVDLFQDTEWNTTDFCWLTLSCNFVNSFIGSSRVFSIGHLGFFTKIILSSVDRKFYCVLSNMDNFFFLTLLHCPGSQGWCWAGVMRANTCVLLLSWSETVSLSLLGIIIAVGGVVGAFLSGYGHSLLFLIWWVLMMNYCWILPDISSAPIEIIIWFSSLVYSCDKVHHFIFSGFEKAQI